MVPDAVGAGDGDIGVKGPSFAGSVNSATSDKPQSKLWYVDGVWFADMFDTQMGAWHIFRLDRATQEWINTGVAIDNRPNTLADALWDGSHLYVASHVVTVSTMSSVNPSRANEPARLYRYSYLAAGQTFSLDAGFPVNINNQSSESLTLDKDATGTLWATWTQVSESGSGFTNQVYVNSSVGDDAAWGTPFVLPAPGAIVAPDDISTLVAFDDSIGVLWSNQLDDAVYWAAHHPGEPLGVWHGDVALDGSGSADDHVNIKSLQSDELGRVFAVVKTSETDAEDAQIELLTFHPSTLSWTATVFGTVDDCHTRPLVMIDETNQLLHVFATAPTSPGCPFSGAPGSIYWKSAPLADPVFEAGRGTPIITDVSSEFINDATSTKQSVTADSGLVVLAVNSSKQRYWHADLSLVPPTPELPVASFAASAQAGTSPLTVEFLDTTLGAPTSWAWDFGDGSTDVVQNPVHTFVEPGVYTVSLVATNTVGESSPATMTVTVTAPSVPVASFGASVLEGPSPLSVAFVDSSLGGPTSWAWDFGDGSGDVVQNPVHTFVDPGVYTVSLVAANALGVSAPAEVTVTVTEPVPAVSAGASTVAVNAVGSVEVTVARPAGLVAGDVLIAQLVVDGVPEMSSVPAGWLPVLASPLSVGSSARVFVYSTVVGDPALVPASWTWGLSSAKKWSAGVSAFSGVDSIALFDSAVSSRVDASYSKSTLRVDGVTTVTPGAMLVGGVGIDTTSVAVAPPAGWSELWETDGGQIGELAVSSPDAPGATANAQWSMSKLVGAAGWMVALRPGN